MIPWFPIFTSVFKFLFLTVDHLHRDCTRGGGMRGAGPPAGSIQYSSHPFLNLLVQPCYITVGGGGGAQNGMRMEGRRKIKRENLEENRRKEEMI